MVVNNIDEEKTSRERKKENTRNRNKICGKYRKNRVNYYNNIKVLASKNLDSKRGLKRILY